MSRESLYPEVCKHTHQVIEELQASYGNYRQVGSVLRLTRELYGIHQKQAAAIMGMTQSAISKLEMGLSDPSFYTFIKYVTILGHDLKIFPKAENNDELSLFYILRHQIAHSLPHDIDNTKESHPLHLEEDEIKHKASDIIRRLVDVRIQKERRCLALSEMYTISRNKPPPSEIGIPDFSIKQMADNLGVSHMTIRRFEKGEADAVTTSMVFRYADRLDLWLSLCEAESKESWKHFVSTCEMLYAIVRGIKLLE